MTDVSSQPQSNRSVLCGVIALSSPLWGGFGIHKFMLSYVVTGIIHLLLTFMGIGIIISVIEGIIYLLKSDEEFYQTYQQGQRNWF